MPSRRLLLALLAAPAVLRAQTVTQDVRLIVPFAPGGTVDALGRMLAEALTPRLGGRSMVVENRSGGGTVIAMQAVANAPPNGHTMSLASTALLATGAVLPGLNLPLDLDTALAPLMATIRVPMVLVTKPSSPFNTVAELITLARANPGRLNAGNSGLGGQTHLLAARLAHEGRFTVEQVTYRGGTPAIMDILAGNNDLYFSLLNESIAFIRDGQLKPIAFASPTRNPTLPQVPLVRETLPGFVGDVGYGMVMHGATPPDWLAFWNAEINRAMNEPAFRERMLRLHWVPANGSAAEYRAEIASERRVWGEVIRVANIRAGS